jgi:thiamine-phosphate pyrophosphorylase
MLRYYITDRRMLGGIEPLIENIRRQIAAGVDWIQIREKDLSTRELLALARRVVGVAAGGTRVLINSRLDVALAAGAHGIHVPSNSPPPAEYRRVAGGLMIGVSCHSREELILAEEEGADYAVLGPVFAPLSKKADGATLGLEQFAELVRAVRIPVLALGGITEAAIPACERAGATGVAGISLFQGRE